MGNEETGFDLVPEEEPEVGTEASDPVEPEAPKPPAKPKGKMPVQIGPD